MRETQEVGESGLVSIKHRIKSPQHIDAYLVIASSFNCETKRDKHFLKIRVLMIKSTSVELVIVLFSDSYKDTAKQ